MPVNSPSIDWNNPDSEAIDGFTVGEIVQMVLDCFTPARCTACRAEHQLEPDARNYDCQACGQEGTVTSPLVKLGFI